jgi:peptidyl-tRNA hydrolase
VSAFAVFGGIVLWSLSVLRSSNVVLLVGLGNPGVAYCCTRHNAGAIFVDLCAEHTGAKWTPQKFGMLAEVPEDAARRLFAEKESGQGGPSGPGKKGWSGSGNESSGQKKSEPSVVEPEGGADATPDVVPRVLLFKPQIPMNGSGSPVLECVRSLKLTSSNVIIVHDDMNTPVGKLRFKFGGSAGGHKGVLDIHAKLKNKDMTRLLIGVGRPALDDQEHVRAYVLEKFPPRELDIIMNACVAYIRSFPDMLAQQMATCLKSQKKKR